MPGDELMQAEDTDETAECRAVAGVRGQIKTMLPALAMLRAKADEDRDRPRHEQRWTAAKVVNLYSKKQKRGV